MPNERGFTYLWLMFLLAITATGLAAIAQPIQLAAHREREAELMFRGQEFAKAIESYRSATPGAVKQLPMDLADLLEDRRGTRVLHHLRRLYADPFTGVPDWVLVRTQDGRISGVHSRAEAKAMRVVGLSTPEDGTALRVSAFVFEVSVDAPATPASAPASVAAHDRNDLSPAPIP